MPVLYIRDKDGKFVPIKTMKGKDGKSAYESALEGGFVGTYEEFCQAIAELSPNAELTPYAKHFNTKNNPHDVTAKQVGAIPEVYYFSADLNDELTQGGNKMTVCYYNTSTLNTPYSEELSDYAHGMVITNAHTEQYGTQLCLPSGDNSMYLRRYNKMGITGWLKISPEDTVKKTGDTLTGAVTVNKDTNWGQYIVKINGCYRSFEADDQRMRFDVRDAENANNRRFLDIYSNIGNDDLSYAIRLGQTNDGETTTATLLHTKNKPSGSYQGNLTTRQVSIGGIGKFLLVSGNYRVAIIGENGGIECMGSVQGTGGSINCLDSTYARFSNGILYLDGATMNFSNATYTYQVL